MVREDVEWLRCVNREGEKEVEGERKEKKGRGDRRGNISLLSLFFPLSLLAPPSPVHVHSVVIEYDQSVSNKR